jgi:protein-S-isoprenylcysteine O-methyltransferase Ste14
VTQPPTPHRPNVHVAPPLIFIAGFGAAVLIDRLVRDLPLADSAEWRVPLALAGFLLVLGGITIALWSVALFQRAQTSVLPFRPSTALVRSGPYRVTRNPMYLGMTLGYVGLTLADNSWWPLILLPVVLLALVRFVIAREEAYLDAIFGDGYRAYRRSVRRWL